MSTQQYREGYEQELREQREAEQKTAMDTLAEIPEKVVRSVLSLPITVVKELFTSNDYDRGRTDAQNGKDFKP